MLTFFKLVIKLLRIYPKEINKICIQIIIFIEVRNNNIYNGLQMEIIQRQGVKDKMVCLFKEKLICH